jgi:hypothetical protein
VNGHNLPANVGDPAWREWLMTFPSIPERDRTSVQRYSKALAGHLARMPDPGTLSRLEAREIAEDLLLYMQELQARQEATVELGGLNFGAAGASFVGAVFFPPAAIPLALFGLGLAGIGVAQKYQQRKRQETVDQTLAALRKLSWRMRR